MYDIRDNTAIIAAAFCLVLFSVEWSTAETESEIEWIESGMFQWNVSPPLVAPIERPGDLCHSIKDPTVVFANGQWHLFCTIRSQKRSHQIETLTFRDWSEANKAERHLLNLTDGYYCAPQVFYYTPHKKWYLICQVIDQSRKPALQPAFSTTETLDDPESWSPPVLLYQTHPANVKMWIDFWVICDEMNAYLFFTSLDGKMWRAETPLEKFPHGWTQPKIVLQADIFEAGHIYKMKGRNQYLALIEAQRKGRRYYKAYIADRLSGQWSPIADTHDKPFASPLNTRFDGPHWTDSFSHGELLRAGNDQTLEADPNDLRFLFQGVSDSAKQGKKYGDIPWRLGLLEVKER